MEFYINYSKNDCYWICFWHHGPGLQLLGPKSAPLFSERNGYRKVLLRFKGWRLLLLKGHK